MTKATDAIDELIAQLQKLKERNPPPDEAVIELVYGGHHMLCDLSKVWVNVDSNDVVRIMGMGDLVGAPIGSSIDVTLPNT